MRDECPNTIAAELDRARALRIIQALRQGSNCLEQVSRFSAGRDVLFSGAADSLEELEISDGAAVRWVKGGYGEGKTHFFARLIEIAHLRNWVTTYVQVSGKGQGTELHRFEEIYAAIVQNCLCRDLVAEEQGRVEPGRISGWRWILDQWYLRLRRLAVGRDTGDVPSFRLRDEIEHSMTSMRTEWNIQGAFAEALRQYALSSADGDEAWRSVLLSWFCGETVHSRGADTRSRLQGAGIRDSISRRNAKSMLRSMSAFLRWLGYGGTLILLDEAENILEQPLSARRTAYTVLRELIDNVDDRNGMTRTAFYVAGTPDLFESAKGIVEYEALATRVLLTMPADTFSPVSTLVDLSAAPLTPDDFAEMGRRVMAVHAVATGWTPGSECGQELARLLRERLTRNPDLSPREWLRAAVSDLDRWAALRPRS